MAKILSEGTLKNRFGIGKANEIGLENSSGLLLVEDNSNNLVYARVKKVNDNASPNANDIATYFDVAGKIVQIGFSFDGASPPSAGANTGLYGFCHTSGGIYNAGEVFFDNGTTLIEVLHCTHLTTGTSITGTISLLANGSYALQLGTWTLKGDGTSAGIPTGTTRMLKIPFTNSSTTVNSTTSLTADTEIISVAVRKSVAFNGTAPTLAVARGVTLLATSDNDLKSTITDISLEPIKILVDGVVTLTVTSDGSSSGTAEVIITYSTTQNV
jgi:hypothetical protein